MTGKPYVLIVDDNPDVRDLLVALVGALDLPVRAVSNGLDALGHIRATPPGVVVLDLSMPDLHGLTVLGRLKMDLERQAIPIIVLTAANLSDDDVLALEKLAARVVRKEDMDVVEFGRLIKAHFRDGRAGQRPAGR